MQELIQLNVYDQGELIAQEFLYPEDVVSVTKFYEQHGYEVRKDEPVNS